MRQIVKRTLALSLAGAVAVGAVSQASAGPLPTSTAAVKKAVPTETIDVRWRGGPFIAGAAIGIIGAAAIANAYRPYYYGPGPYYYAGYPPYYVPYPHYAADPYSR